MFFKKRKNKELTVQERFDFFKDSFRYCGTFLLEKDDEDLLFDLFDEFDTFAISFLHDNTLTVLLQNDYINEEIFSLCQSLRKKYFALGIDNKHVWTSDEIRLSSEWLALFQLADKIKALIQALN